MLHCSRPFFLRQRERYLNKKSKPAVCNHDKIFKFWACILFFLRNPDTELTDETLSDPSAQMRKHLKERRCWSEGKQFKASRNYSHSLKEFLFKYSIICICSPWKCNTFIKLVREKLWKINLSSFQKLKLILRTCSGHDHQQELNVKIKAIANSS